MFEKHGYEFTVIPSGVEEKIPEGLSPAETVLYLSFCKARDVEKKVLAAKEDSQTFIVGADTIVWLPAENRVLGKPKDPEDARKMLRSLANRVNVVFTGVTIIEAGTTNRKSFAVSSEVYMMDYPNDYIDAYVASGEPMDKAGGYALQGTQASKIEKVVGSTDNVIGFPWKEAEAEWTKMGFHNGR